MRRLDPSTRLLLRLPSWLGDLVMAEPVARAAAERWSAAGHAGGLSLAAPGRLLELFEGRFPGVRRLPTGTGTAAEARAWRGHDTALLLVGSFRSAWTALRAGIPRRVGWARDARRFLLTESWAPARELGRVPLGLGRAGRWPRYLPRPYTGDCVELAQLAGLDVADVRPRLAPSEAARELAAARLRGFAEDYVLACVGARPGSTKAYPAAQWARVLTRLVREGGAPVLLTCGPGEEALAEELAAALPRGSARALTAPVAGLGELAALAAGARLALTGDTGPRHVAAAAGAPVLVLCGPTDPRHTAAGLERTRLLREEVDCGPCHEERCPLAGAAEHACMRGLLPERVAAVALEMMRAAG